MYKNVIKKIEKCCQCNKYKICFITENDEGETEYYCEYCYTVTPVKKLETQSRTNNDLNFVGNARFINIFAKYPRISYEN